MFSPVISFLSSLALSIPIGHLHGMPSATRVSPTRVHKFIHQLFDPLLYANRVASIADATLAVLRGTSLAIHAIGAGLAMAIGKHAKHATKQVDRLLSNPAFDLDILFQQWVIFVLAQRTVLIAALDWTDFEHDDHTTSNSGSFANSTSTTSSASVRIFSSRTEAASASALATLFPKTITPKSRSTPSSTALIPYSAKAAFTIRPWSPGRLNAALASWAISRS